MHSVYNYRLFNKFLCDIFLIMKDRDFASYAGYNTRNTKWVTLDDVIETLQNDSTGLYQWFKDKQMKVHKDKCHLF